MAELDLFLQEHHHVLLSLYVICAVLHRQGVSIMTSSSISRVAFHHNVVQVPPLDQYFARRGVFFFPRDATAKTSPITPAYPTKWVLCPLLKIDNTQLPLRPSQKSYFFGAPRPS